MEEKDHPTFALQSLLGLYWNAAKPLAMLVSIAVCLPAPQFCSLQQSLQRLGTNCSRQLHWSIVLLQPESCEDVSSVSTDLVEAYVWQGSEYIAAAPWGQHRAGFPQRLQVSGSAPIGAAPGGAAAMLEAIKQVLACLRKSGSLFLEVLLIHSALELKCPCLPWAAIALTIFKLFICVQSSWPSFSVTCQHSQRVGIQIWGWTHILLGVLFLALSLWFSMDRRCVTLSCSVKAQLALPLNPAWDQTCLASLVLVCT